MRISDWSSDVCSSDLIYAPVGGHKDLLAYLVRRLLENGANSSFVHQLADEHKSDEELLADPVEKVKAVGGTRHPSIALPRDLYQPERIKRAGLDLGNQIGRATCRERVCGNVKVLGDAVAFQKTIRRQKLRLERITQ